jgi:hypothetical protein
MTSLTGRCKFCIDSVTTELIGKLQIFGHINFAPDIALKLEVDPI